MKRVRRQSKLDSFEKDDEIWAVFDNDDHPRVKESIDLCHGNDVGVAYSNPCFEVWLLLHIGDFDKPDDRFQVQKHLEKIHTVYVATGAKRPNCEELVKSVAKAEERCEYLLERRTEEGSPLGRPCTTVGYLTRRIREAAELSSKMIE